jgi:DNA-binding transcriptional MerR regulator
MQTQRKTPRDEHATLALTVEELAAAAGVSARTVRYYIAQGLLAGPLARGRQASYGEEHLLRLRLIRRLAERHTPLAQIRKLVAPLALDEVVSLLDDEDQRQGDRARGRSSAEEVADLLHTPLHAAPEPRARPLAGHGAYAAAPYESVYEGVRETSWRRWDLAPGVELHVREDAHARRRDLIARLLREARAQENPRHDSLDTE